MAINNSSGNTQFPDARVKGLRQFFDVVRQNRDWNPDTITIETFQTLGMAPSKERNAVFALKFLGILNGKGEPIEEFFNLREDYSGTLTRLVKSSYEGVFNTIPKNLITQKTLVNYFKQKGYAEDTAEYQAKLFVELCKDAKIDLPNAEQSFHRARFNKDQ